ncbi:hypothetical protein CBR_g17730 [Chara braunii]|uniref:RING-type E3 ubiquitin transferase n=1 Tax=Chara braunii TaxID=69332 RepID=A0A388KVE1_CHABU|nr:hypothetical protein CBR_g17730 [Chara braunii]|eukprot:GBG74019.1 hypothetical protein CBR_g17730 [Chara braunii]
MISFELHRTYVMAAGRLIRQETATPMGNSTSPPLACILCAFNGYNFLTSLGTDRKLDCGTSHVVVVDSKSSDCSIMSVDVNEGSVRADTDEEVCRICRTAGTEEAPLYFPCACSGSIKYVHQDCLQRWLSHSNAQRCEVCKQEFAFSPVYAEDAPSKLPFQEILLGLCVKGWRSLRFLFRLFLVVFSWLVLVPFVTCSLWRLFFLRSLREARFLLHSRLAPALLLTDCVYGWFLSAGIVFVFLGFTSLRDYHRQIRHQQGRAEAGLDAEDEQDVQFGVEIGVAERQQPLVLPRRGLGRLGWAADQGGGNVGGIQDGLERGWEGDDQAAGRGGHEGLGAGEGRVALEEGAAGEGTAADNATPMVEVVDAEDAEGEEQQVAGGEAREGRVREAGVMVDGEDGPDLDDIQLQGAALEARMEAQLDQMFDDNDGVGNDEVPLEELVGLQGPVLHLLENAVTVIVSNALFLAIAVLVPFTIGRAVIVLAGHFASGGAASSTTAVPQLRSYDFVPFIANQTGVPNPSDLHFEDRTAVLPWMEERTVFQRHSADRGLSRILSNKSLSIQWTRWWDDGQRCRILKLGQRCSVRGNAAGHLLPCDPWNSSEGADQCYVNLEKGEGPGAAGAVREAEVVVISSWMSERLTLLIGYAVLLSTLGLYLLLVPLMRGRPSNRNRREVGEGENGTAWIMEAAPLFGRQIVLFLRHGAMVLKVASLLFLELGVFPLMCGIWLDVCSLRMLDASLKQRAAFLAAAPVVFTMLHWLIGIVYMLQISIFVSLLRETLRPGVLSFLRDPADPNFDPVRDLVNEPLHKHLWRVFLSFIVYSSLIVMLVYVPISLIIQLSPRLFPLNLKFSDPFIELPADMLLFHIFVPFTIEHFQPRLVVKKLMAHWFLVVGGMLGLVEFLLPLPQEAAGEGPQFVNEEGPPQNLDLGGAREAAEVLPPAGGEPHEPVRLRQEPLEEVEAHHELEPVGDAIKPPVPDVGGIQEIVEGGKEDRASDWDEDRDVEELEEEEEGRDAEEYMFAVRIVVLLVSAWLSLVVVNLNVGVLPITIGRWTFASLTTWLPVSKGLPCNDLYAFGIGCYLLWGLFVAVQCTVRYVKAHGAGTLLPQALRWTGTVLKSVGLLSLWLGLIPLLIGLLFDLLVVVPLHTPLDERLKLLYYQDWAVGLLLLEIWMRLVMLGQVMPFGIGDDRWRNKFERIRNDGFMRLHGMWVLKEVIAPIVGYLLTLLCLPYACAKGLMALISPSPQMALLVPRFACLGTVVAVVLWRLLQKSRAWLIELHDSIRDDRYLIGQRLHNYTRVVGGSAASRERMKHSVSASGGSQGGVSGEGSSGESAADILGGQNAEESKSDCMAVGNGESRGDQQILQGSFPRNSPVTAMGLGDDVRSGDQTTEDKRGFGGADDDDSSQASAVTSVHMPSGGSLHCVTSAAETRPSLTHGTTTTPNGEMCESNAESGAEGWDGSAGTSMVAEKVDPGVSSKRGQADQSSEVCDEESYGGTTEDGYGKGDEWRMLNAHTQADQSSEVCDEESYGGTTAVSYTHLDVYKRQHTGRPKQ